MGGRRRTTRSEKAPWLAGVTVAYLVWSLAPIVIAIAFSFNKGSSISRWEGFTLRWWAGRNPFAPGLLHDLELRTALLHSLSLAAIPTVVVAPVGTMLALGLGHWRAWPARAVLLLVLGVLALPPVFLGTSLWIVFTSDPLRRFPFGEFGWFGTRAQVAGLVTLYLPLATLVVLVRYLLLDRQNEEMAADLGASPTQILRRVLLPQLRSAIVASAAVVFASAIGEFVVVDILVGPNPTRALAPALLGAANGPEPIDNAIGTVLALSGAAACAAMAVAFHAAVPRWRTSGRPRL
jgi:spermidine/putrescine transport system permease protein